MDGDRGRVGREGIGDGMVRFGGREMGRVVGGRGRFGVVGIEVGEGVVVEMDDDMVRFVVVGIVGLVGIVGEGIDDGMVRRGVVDIVVVFQGMGSAAAAAAEEGSIVGYTEQEVNNLDLREVMVSGNIDLVAVE